MFRKSGIEEIAFERLSICETCDEIDKEGSKCAVAGTAPCCGVCGCKLSFKARSLSSECPHPDGAKWQATMTPEEQDELYARIKFDPEKEPS